MYKHHTTIHLSSAPMDSNYKSVLSATCPTGGRGWAQSHPPGGGPALPGPSPLLSMEGAFHGWSAWAPGFGEAVLPNSLQSSIALLTNKTTLKASDKFFQGCFPSLSYLAYPFLLPLVPQASLLLLPAPLLCLPVTIFFLFSFKMFSLIFSDTDKRSGAKLITRGGPSVPICSVRVAVLPGLTETLGHRYKQAQGRAQ